MTEYIFMILILILCGADVGPVRQIFAALMTRMKWHLADVDFVDRPVVRSPAENMRRGAVSSHQR